MASSKRLISRLMTINTSILIFYLLLSVSHEGLFLVTLNCNVMCWVLIEFRLLYLGRVKVAIIIFLYSVLTCKQYGISDELKIITLLTPQHLVAILKVVFD